MPVDIDQSSRRQSDLIMSVWVRTWRIFLLLFPLVGVALFLSSAQADFNGSSMSSARVAITPQSESQFEKFIRSHSHLIWLKDVTVDETIQARLLEIARQRADFWGDSILEGEYEAEGNTSLDRVNEVYFESTFIGYHITYSQDAWFTGRCDYDSRNKATLRNCEAGRISESYFVSQDFRDMVEDQDAYAQFQN